MKYEEFLERKHFTHPELLASAWGTLIENPPAGGVPPLPAPPFLMFDRIVEVEHHGQQGLIVAEQDVRLDAWYFQCHFRNDPVQPGCLGVDAIWQLLGFYSAIRGGRGAGRALGVKEVEFNGQIRPLNKIVKYVVSVRRFSELPANGSTLVVGTGEVFVDGELIYTVKDAKVGVFAGIQYAGYPHRTENSAGGQIKK